jgi:hypothetical protein
MLVCVNPYITVIHEKGLDRPLNTTAKIREILHIQPEFTFKATINNWF